MALIDSIKEMQEQGLSDSEISQKLQEEGFSPQEINDSISQGKIKAAISGNEYEQNGQDSIISSQMQPSITQEIQEPEQQYAYPQPQQEYYQPQPQVSAETISEIAEQIVIEKLSDIKKALNMIADFKAIVDAKTENMEFRLKKIESIIENLQASILGRVGDYGRAIEDIKSEIGNMEESFSKLVNPLVDKSRKQVKEEPEQERAGKKKDSFENYLR